MNFLQSAIKQFHQYKLLGENAFAQLTTEEIMSRPVAHSNSIAIIIRHMSGNMLSRWTDLLTTDGEKPGRNRAEEFKDWMGDRQSLMIEWDKGWNCLFKALQELTPAETNTVIFIRGEAHSVTDAILRQLCHYSYHIGQIVLIARQFKGDNWNYLSIPLNDQNL